MDPARPYLNIPTIELIRRELCAHGVGALIETSVRRLAGAIGRSEGQISVHLNRLEADGWIRRLADHRGTVVEVLRIDHADDRLAAAISTDHPHDRSFMASQSDHADDRPRVGDHPVLTPNPDRAPHDRSGAPAAIEASTDHADDRSPHTPHGNNMIQDQQQQPAHAREGVVTPKTATSRPEGESGEKPPIWADLVRAGAKPWIADAILRKNSRLTPAQFDAMCATAALRGGQPDDHIGLVFYCLLNGESLYAPSEERHDHTPSTKRPTPAHRSQRSAPQPAAPAPAVDYDVLLAEIAAANPDLRL